MIKSFYYQYRVQENMMAYDEGLAQRIHEMVDEIPGLTSKKMFGGVGYMIDGNMAVGVTGDNLIVRLGPDAHQEALSKPNTHEFGPAGRTMRGWVTVEPEGVEEDEALREWVENGVAFAQSLPPK